MKKIRYPPANQLTPPLNEHTLQGWWSDAVLDAFQMSDSSTYIAFILKNQVFSCQPSHTRFTFFYLTPYALSLQPVISCMPIHSNSLLYASYARTILVVHGLPPLPRFQIPNSPTSLDQSDTLFLTKPSHFTPTSCQQSVTLIKFQPTACLHTSLGYFPDLSTWPGLTWHFVTLVFPISTLRPLSPVPSFHLTINIRNFPSDSANSRAY